MFPFLTLLIELLLLIGSEDRPDLRPDRLARRRPRLLLVFHALLPIGRRLHQDRADLILLRVGESILLAQAIEMMIGHLLGIDRAAFMTGASIVAEPALMSLELAVAPSMAEAAVLLAPTEATGAAHPTLKMPGPAEARSAMLEPLILLPLKAAMMTAHEGHDQDRYHHYIQHQTGDRHGFGPNQSGIGSVIRTLGNGLAHMNIG